MPHWERSRKQLTPPKAHSQVRAPAYLYDLKTFTTWERRWTQPLWDRVALAPLFRSLLGWQWSCTEYCRRARRYKSFEDMAHTGPQKGPLQIAWVNSGNWLMQIREKKVHQKQKQATIRATELAKGKRHVGASISHLSPGTVKCVITAQVHGKRQQQKALCRLEWNEIHYVGL